MPDKTKLKEKPKNAPEAPSKPVVKDEPATVKTPPWRQGHDIKMALHRIGESNFATVATSSTKLAKMGLHYNLAEGVDPEYVLTISIPSDLDGGWNDMQLPRETGEEVQALYNAFPRKVPFHMLPAGCELEQEPEKKRKKKKAPAAE